MISIDYIKYKPALLTKKIDGKLHLFDPIRKKYLVLMPEEVVRQLVIQYLITEKQYNLNWMNVEKAFYVNDRMKRFDLLVYDKQMKPYLLVEMKAPKIKVNEDVLEQIAWYNLPIQAPFIMITNGIDTFCYKMNYEAKTFENLMSIPSPSKSII